VNVDYRSPVTELHVKACVIGSTYAFHLIAESLTARPFWGSFFVGLTVLPLKSPTVHPIFDDITNVANGEACLKLVH